MFEKLFLIFLSTLLSEDLTCISVGILVQAGKLEPVSATLACTLGIFLGDYLLFLTGREILSLLKKKKRKEALENSRLYQRLADGLKHRFLSTLFIARFVPGTRLPIYTFSGMIAKSSGPFLLITFIASLLWTPILIYLSFLYGQAFKKFYTSNSLTASILLAIFSIYLLYQMVLLLIQKNRREDVWIRIQKIPKLEFWPSVIFYTPLIPYVCYLIIRYGSIRLITASNPLIPMGGIMMESKFSILKSLPVQWIAKATLFEMADKHNASVKLYDFLKTLNSPFPIIAKPDIGERGRGLKLIANQSDLDSFVKNLDVNYIFQEYHPGPFEAGIFYYRMPGENQGKIFSITKKTFPVLIGDGKHTIEELIKRHPRFKFQKNTFLDRNLKHLNVILSVGETFSLGFTGNHIQGCMFEDGSDLITKELERSIDTISLSCHGFFFGRYDIRYKSESDLKEGHSFKIIELNGAMSESTNLYDPKFTIWKSYSILFQQWKLLFQIGKKNHEAGTLLATYKEFYALWQSYQDYIKQIDPISKEFG